MGIMVGSARIDERGQVSGGAAGDQKQTAKGDDYKGEVSMQPFYIHSKGWYILHPKDPVYAKAIAHRMVTACNNKNLGYDQGNRLGVITYGVESKQPTECDCSSLVRACIKEATGKDPGNFTTLNEADALERTGLFVKRREYVSQIKTPVYNGDVLVTKTKGHTVVVVVDDMQDKQETYYPRYTGKNWSIVEALSAVGEKDVSKAHRTQIAKANGILDYIGSAEQNKALLAKLKKGELRRA